MGHVVHQFACEDPDVFELCRVLGRDDEAKVMSILFAASGKGVAIGRIGSCIEEIRLLAVTGDAIALEVGHMASEWCRSKPRSFVPDHARFDDHAAVG